MGASSRCPARRAKSAAGSAARRCFWFGLCGDILFPGGELDTDAAVTDEAAGLGEHRLPADLELLFRAVRIDAAENEIEKRLTGCNRFLQLRALRLVPARPLRN